MTATDELRRLLDGRGIEYYPKTADTTIWASDSFCYVRSDADLIDGRLELFIRPVTPQQAVEATLGRGTCRQIETEEGFIVCSECGAPQPEDYTVYYCWCCGRKVVDA